MNADMEILFDQALVAARRENAARKCEPGASFLVDLAAQELAERLAVVERQFDDAVELHGGTGAAGRQALATGKIGRLTRVETSSVFAASGECLIEAALDEVPLEPASTSLVLSPLSLHLDNDIPGTLVRIRRALRPDGLFMAAIPGACTLGELRDVLLAAEAELTGGASPRVIPFADVRDVGALLQRAGFALPVVDVETYTVRYDSLFPLMRDLRAMGMANPLAGRSRVPVDRRFFLRAAELYAERYSDPDGRIRATFSIIYASGWAPHESQQKPLKPGSAKMRLADALRVPKGDEDSGR
jgi:SAM-dependent methyltransferase